MPNGKIVIETQIDTKKFDKQIDEIDKKSQILENEISKKKKMNIDTTEAEAQLEKLKNKFIELNEKSLAEGLKSVRNIEFDPTLISKLSNAKVQTEGFNDALTNLNGELPYVASNMKNLRIESEKIEKQQKKTNKELSKGFDKGTKSLKKFGLSLFSIHSIYSLISKASSSYLSQNEELANKLQSVWIGLGSFLEPILTMLSDVLLKALGYLNVFVKALTGVDYIANANAKALEKQAQAQNKLNKATQQYDFDVVRTQQDTSSSNTTSSSSSGYIDIPELDEGIVSKLQDLAYWLSENKELIEAVGVALGVTFGAVAVSNLLNNIKTMIGLGTAGGLAGLSTSLLAIATVFTVTLAIEGIVEVKKQVDELNVALEKNTQQQQYLLETQDKVSDKFWELYNQNKLTDEQIEKYSDTLKGNTDNYIKQYDEIKKTIKILDFLGFATGDLKDQQKILIERMEQSTDEYKNLYDQGLLNEEQTKDYIEQLGKQIEFMNDLGIDVSDLKTQYENLTNSTYYIQVKVKDETEEAYNKIKSRFSSLSGTSSSIGYDYSSIWSSYSKSGTGFALGGVVTQPTRALIGEAGYNEYVLPEREDYLSRLASLIGQYGNGGSGTTNVYLNGRLIQKEISRVEQKINFASNN